MKENIPNGWDLKSVIALTNIKKFTHNECSIIINKYTSFEHFKDNAFDLQQRIFFEDNDEKSKLEIAQEQLDFAEENNFKIITIWDDIYPNMLKQIDYPPVVLYVWGDLQLPDALSISVVGTRKCSQYGKLVTEHFVSEFVKQNIIITSGMAYGIDSIAHRTAVKNGGISYAVIASGLDKIQPQIAMQLAREIVAAGGAIISEYKFGTSALQGYFLQRNRIISGISKATLVVESAYKGGSLNTAKFADLQSRDVFVIPGNITAEKSIGTNNLIRKHKAMIALSPTTMLKDMGLAKIDYDTENIQQKITFSCAAEEKIYNNLSKEPLHIDALIELTGLDISEILIQLIDMELNDVVKQLPGKYYIRGY